EPEPPFVLGIRKLRALVEPLGGNGSRETGRERQQQRHGSGQTSHEEDPCWRRRNRERASGAPGVPRRARTDATSFGGSAGTGARLRATRSGSSPTGESSVRGARRVAATRGAAA